MLAIACSTGGPQALSKLLQELPGTFPCPVLIAQHIADGFAKDMVRWLDSVTELKVRLAQEDDRVQAGYVYILPPEQHLIVKTTSVWRRSPDRKVTFTIPVAICCWSRWLKCFAKKPSD